MSTHNICFYEEVSKIITKLSSNTHLIFSAGSFSNFMDSSVWHPDSSVDSAFGF